MRFFTVLSVFQKVRNLFVPAYLLQNTEEPVSKDCSKETNKVAYKVVSMYRILQNMFNENLTNMVFMDRWLVAKPGFVNNIIVIHLLWELHCEGCTVLEYVKFCIKHPSSICISIQVYCTHQQSYEKEDIDSCFLTSFSLRTD